MPEQVSMTRSIELDHGYPEFERIVADRIANAKGPLFTTDVKGLWDAYLSGIPGESHHGQCNCGADRTGPSAEAHDPKCPANVIMHSGPRQHYNCRTCFKFIEKYGGLATIGEEGHVDSILWHALDRDVPEFFQQSVVDMYRLVERAKVTGMFFSGEATWGTPVNISRQDDGYWKQWTHLHGVPNLSLTWRSKSQTAEQAMAEKLQDFIMLKRALVEIPLEAAVQAVRVLEADELDRSEKTLSVARWFLELHQRINGMWISRNRTACRGDNLVWLAVATAPPGFCHVRSTMIGTLLDDVLAGLPFETIRSRWGAKMHRRNHASS